MKARLFSCVLLAVAMLFASNANADTFKILSLRNGNAYDGVESGSVVEYLNQQFSMVFEKEAQKSSYPNISMVCQESGAMYTPNSGRIYPNEYYTATDGSFSFDFFNGMLNYEGTYVVTVGEGSYVATDGSVNEEYVATFTIKKPEDFPFEITSVTNRGYEAGTDLKYLDMRFNVVAENGISKCDGSRIDVYRGNLALGKITDWSYETDGSCTLVFGTWYTGTKDGVDEGKTTVGGTYRLVFQAGAFRDANNYTSKAFECQWKVSASAVEPELDTNIGGVEQVEGTSSPMYDLSGRKITHRAANSIVIKDGIRYFVR